MQWSTRLLVLNLLCSLAACQFMSRLPLIVKTPYLHTWITAQAVSSSGGMWPSLWNGNIVGWSSWIRVDGTSYQWTGQTLNSRPIMTANQVTPTRTIFTFAVPGRVGFNVTYLSPIDPTDMVRQSLPFGYFYVDVWSLDGKSHSVQFYTDITGEILSSVVTDPVQWNTTQAGNVMYHRMWLGAPNLSMQEFEDTALDSTLVFAIENRADLTWQTGAADEPVNGLRARFDSGQPLTNTADTDFRGKDNDWPVVAFRVDLGNITQTSDSVVWSLGLMRDPVIQYKSSAKVQSRKSYHWSAYSTVDDIVNDVIGKFNDVRTNAINLDNKILSDGGSISSNYNDLLSFALRLVFGAMDITIPMDLNTADAKIFMRDIGVSSRSSPVDTIYAALPALLYVNASIVGLVLEPLLQFQNSSDYNNAYAAPDLGNSYPQVLGNTSDTTPWALESCGNMLIMTLAHAMKSGDGSLIDRYYNLLKSWAAYLEVNSLRPSGINADGENVPNLSNLALKGIVGMHAMSKISEAVGISDDASHFQSQAQRNAGQWETLATTSGHLTSTYGNASSWGLIYNLYAAMLLGQDSISSQTYDQQSQFYASKMGTTSKYGFPYDTNDAGKAKSHWSMFTAATVSDTSVRDFIVNSVWNRAALNDTAAFPTTYNSSNGSLIGGAASPAHGAMFAQLALNIANKDISRVPTTGTDGKRKTNVGAIVGGVGGFLIVAGLAAFFWRRHRKRKASLTPITEEHLVYEPFSTRQVDNVHREPTITTLSKNGRGDAYYRSSRNPSSASGTAGASSSRSGASQDLRSEMEQLIREQLRREMDALRNERIQESEPPPLYDSDGDINNVDVEENIGAAGVIQDSTSVIVPHVPSSRKELPHES